MAALAQVQLNPMRVAIYVRISPTPEDDVGGNYSIASQIYEIRQHAIQKGFGDVPDSMVFIDENFSGKSLDRPALERLRGLIRDRMVDMVIAFSSDRVSRKLTHLLIVQDECDRYDVALQYVKESYEKSPEGRMAMQVKGIFNEYEREKILERTTRCRRQKMREGHPHTVGKRFGYDYIGRAQGNRGELVINTAEAAIVLEAFTRYDTGTGRNCLYQIRKWLNDSGILSANAGKRTKGNPSQHELKMLPAHPATGDRCTTGIHTYEWGGKRWYRINDGKWSKQTVLQLLTNPMYIGKMRTPAGIEALHCPAIVSEELFHRVQQKIAGNKTALAGRQSREYLFAHMIWCTACGGRCYAQSGRYRCGNYSTKTFVRGCTASQIQHKRLDPAGWRIIWQAIIDPPVLLGAMKEYYASEMQARPADKRDELRKAVEHLKRLLARATEVLNDPDQPTPYDEAKRNVLRLRGDLLAAEEQLRRQVLIMPDEFQVHSMIQELLDPDAEPKEFADRREVLQHLEIKIHYLDNEMEIHGKFPVAVTNITAVPAPSNGGSGKRNNGVSHYSFSQGAIPFVLKRRVA